MTVRFFAAAAAAAGTPERVVPLAAVPAADGYDAGTLGALVAYLGSAQGSAAPTASAAPAAITAPSLARVLGRSSFLLNEVNVRDRTRPLAVGDTVDVLPPFAGG
ncbi:MoaD/ThiS family protein [Arthrobacter ginkgonis]|uniref:MoaD/ThiS family protein n=1 Tax=Arthrobacter ginkgonis TaxID=1630594 RepID=A0ABP7CQY5_9MICC